MCPVAEADGHDAPGLIDEAVPGMAAVTDDVVVIAEHAVGQPVIPNPIDQNRCAQSRRPMDMMRPG